MDNPFTAIWSSVANLQLIYGHLGERGGDWQSCHIRTAVRYWRGKWPPRGTEGPRDEAGDLAMSTVQGRTVMSRGGGGGRKYSTEVGFRVLEGTSRWYSADRQIDMGTGGISSNGHCLLTVIPLRGPWDSGAPLGSTGRWTWNTNSEMRLKLLYVICP